jgi:selenide,water dikinase
VKRILLIGAGHAHLAALRDLAEKPLYGARMALVSEHAKQIYSGMLPGFLAGHYHLEDIQIDIAQVAARAFVEFIPGKVVGFDPAQHVARLEDGSELAYEIASVNAGSAIDASVPGREHAVTVKPFDAFLERLDRERPARIAIAGAGIGGMELAMALRFRGAAVTLYSERAMMSRALLERVIPAMRRCGVDYRPGMPVSAIEAGPVVVAGASRQAFDMVVLATGAAPLGWLRSSGLATDERGFIQVERTLRSASNAAVFATGDCATMKDAAEPKSGVFAVRQGETLVENLRRSATRDELKSHPSRRRALQLVSCGGKYAIAERGTWSAEGGWVWRWKDWIDRRWLRSLSSAGQR